MSTDNERIRVTVPLHPALYAAIEDYRFNTRAKNQAAAVRELLARGLAAYAQETGGEVTHLSGVDHKLSVTAAHKIKSVG